jgi:hypothetical protein
VTYAKFEVNNPFGSMDHLAERARGSDESRRKVLSDSVGGDIPACLQPSQEKETPK